MFRDVIEVAGQNGHLFVAAAGNDGIDLDTNPSFPGGWDLDNILTVAATDQDDDLADFSTFGPTSVDLGAPGVNILSTRPGGTYGFSDGTSMASPHVAGAAGFLLGLDPSLTHQQLKSILMDTADTVPSLVGTTVSGGRLNLTAAAQLSGLQLGIFARSIPEDAGAGAALGRVRRFGDLTLPASVELTSSDITEATVPAVVTIPAGENSAFFSIDAVDDNLLDGTQSVAITATLGINSDVAVIDVTDVENLTLTISPGTIREDAGAGAAIGTLQRTDNESASPNLLVTSGNVIFEYDPLGTLIGTTDIEDAGSGEDARDIAVTSTGDRAVYNGSDNASLSLYDPISDTWSHQSVAGLNADTDLTGSGIASYKNFVFLADVSTGTDDPRGIVRFDTLTGETIRFGNKVTGDRLFATISSVVHDELVEIDPATGQVRNAFEAPYGRGVRDGLAYDGTALWYMGSRLGDEVDDLFRLNSETGAILDQYDLGIDTVFGGLAYLNGNIFILDTFIQNRIIVWDIANERVDRIMDINADISGGLAAATGPDSLYVTDTFSNEVYEIDPDTGAILSSFDQTVGIGDLGLAVVDNEIYVGTNTEDTVGVFDRSGNFLRSIDIPGSIGLGSLGGDDVQGPVDSELQYSDLSIGHDGVLYALDEGNSLLVSYDPDAFTEIAQLDLGANVTSIAIDAFGTVFGVQGSNIVKFDADGSIDEILDTGAGTLIDLDVSLSGNLLAGTSNGIVVQASTDFTAPVTTFTGGAGDIYVTFAAAPGTSTGDVTVTLTNSDSTEISIPTTVIIPAGAESVSFPIDAVDDRLIDGTQTVTITPSAPGYESVSGRSIDVLDVEEIILDVDESVIAESAGPNAAVISISRSNLDGPFDYPTTQVASNTAGTPILDADTVVSQVTIEPLEAFVVDVDVSLSLAHGHLGDLDVFLISPEGTRVELFTDVGGIGTSIEGLILDDQAGLSVASGSSPFTGRHRPEGSLAAFAGEVVSGTWTLEITDDTGLASGELLEWGISVSAVGFGPLDVTVVTSDSTEAEPQSFVVTIPENTAGTQIPLDAIDDSILDGSQTVTITGSGTGYIDGSDSLVVEDTETIRLSIDRDTFPEDAGAGAAVGTVTRTDDGDLTNPVVVSLESRDRSELRVPDTVTIPAGQTSATFDIEAIDDFNLDGTVRVRINATATGYDVTSDSRAFVLVTDAEVEIAVEIEVEEVFENERFISGVLRRVNASSLDDSLAVSLTSSLPVEVSVPPSVTIPAGQESVAFTITLTDNDVLNGERTVVISADAAGTFGGSKTITLKDFETLSLAFSPDEFNEARTTTASIGTVTRNNSDIDEELVVNLNSDDTSELEVPETVTIPAGQSSVEFPITAVNDDEFDGAQIVGITAIADGYISANSEITVLDHEPTTITGPEREVNTSRPTITWEAVEGATRYHIRINNVSTGENQVINIDDLGADVTSFTPTQQLEIGRHRVFIRYQNEFEQWQPFTSGYLLEILPSPTFTSPISLPKEDVPTFEWTDVIGAEFFQLRVDDLTRGEDRVIDERELVNTSFQPESLPEGVYEAQVRAVGPDGIRGPWTFTKFTVLPRPVILTPTGGSSFDQRPTITFEGSIGADHYDVRIHDLTLGLDNGGRNIVRDRFVTSTSFTPEIEFELGHKYQISVAAVTESGERSAFSDRVIHNVGARPVILSPTDGGEAGVIPVIRFDGVDGAKKHQVRIRLASGGGNIVFDRSVQGNAFSPREALEEGEVYRVWVRSISILGQRTLWASATFTVTSDTTSIEMDLGQPDTGNIETVATIDAESAPIQDSAPIVVNSYVEAIEPPADALVPSAAPVSKPVAPKLEADVIDSVMGSLPEMDADWWSEPSQDDVNGESMDLSPATTAGAVLLGAALSTMKRKRRDED
jgi:subtilisin-like proprotein convertase family protein